MSLPHDLLDAVLVYGGSLKLASDKTFVAVCRLQKRWRARRVASIGATVKTRDGRLWRVDGREEGGVYLVSRRFIMTHTRHLKWLSRLDFTIAQDSTKRSASAQKAQS